MSRLKADLLLLLAAVIWGAAFVAQKDAMAHVGVYAFLTARFGISVLIVLPLALRERGRMAADALRLSDARKDIFYLCIAFVAGVIFQQEGVALTSVTNAGFLTGIYVLFVPVICALLYKEKLTKLVFPAAVLSVAGVWLLSGGLSSVALSLGDLLVLCCAVAFAFHVTLIGRVMWRVKAPFQLCLLQYSVLTAITLALTLALESPTWDGLVQAGIPILYAGIFSGGIAYTVQVVAQQHTPASDSAVILSAESLFAALFGYLMMGDRLTVAGGLGCGFIICAILMVEFGPLVLKSKRVAASQG